MSSNRDAVIGVRNLEDLRRSLKVHTDVFLPDSFMFICLASHLNTIEDYFFLKMDIVTGELFSVGKHIEYPLQRLIDTTVYIWSDSRHPGSIELKGQLRGTLVYRQYKYFFVKSKN